MSIWPRFLLILALTLAKTAIAGETGLPCDKPQDALTKAVCAYKLDASASFIASKIAPDKPVLVWLKSIASDCNEDAECIERSLFTEWLRYSAHPHSFKKKEKAISDEDACAGFKQLLTDGLTNTQSKDTPQQILLGFNLSIDNIKIAAANAGVNFDQLDSEPWSYTGSKSASLFMVNEQPAIGFDISDGGTLYCYTQRVIFVDEATRNVDELGGVLPEGCMAETSYFYQFKNHPFSAKYSPLLDGAQYEVFSLTDAGAKPLCTVTGKQTLKYQSHTKYCPITNHACALLSKESMQLARYFDEHPDSRLIGEKLGKNTEANRLMPNAITEDLPQYGYPSYPANLGIPEHQLVDMNAEIGRYADFRPWQLIKLEGQKYLVSVIDGSYDFDGYIFYIEKYDSQDGRQEESAGFVVVKREKTGPAKITITYPSSPTSSGNATAQ